jgi:hypothetical protein
VSACHERECLDLALKGFRGCLESTGHHMSIKLPVIVEFEPGITTRPVSIADVGCLGSEVVRAAELKQEKVLP